MPRVLVYSRVPLTRRQGKNKPRTAETSAHRRRVISRVVHSSAHGVNPTASRAGVTQLAEYLLPKQNVAGSIPVSRSTSSILDLRSMSLEAPTRTL